VKIPAAFWVGLAGSIAVESALVFYAWRTGSYLLPLFGAFLMPPLILVHLCIGWLSKWLRANSTKTGVAQKTLWCFATIALVGFGWIEGTPKAAFKRMVMDPIPDSVRDIHWGGGEGINYYFLVSFRAAPEDVARIIDHHRMVRDSTTWIGADSDNLSKEDINSFLNHMLSSYCRRFKLPYEPLDDPEVYRQLKDSEGKPRTPIYRLDIITDGHHRKVYLISEAG
jgi:hypothetical protein